MITVIDYGMGNLRSIWKGLEFVGGEVEVTNDLGKIKNAEKIVLPGVGAFGDGMTNLRTLGIDTLLKDLILNEKKPFLGVCLGMQLLAKKSYEFGEHEGLGIIDAEVKRFTVDETHHLSVPHVGWNTIELKNPHPFFEGIPEKADFYFVHSYFVDCTDTSLVAATCDYGISFPAILAKENIFATQFHPEKSQKYGLRLLKNFVEFK